LPERGKSGQEVLGNCGPQSIGKVENKKVLMMTSRKRRSQRHRAVADDRERETAIMAK